MVCPAPPPNRACGFLPARRDSPVSILLLDGDWSVPVLGLLPGRRAQISGRSAPRDHGPSEFPTAAFPCCRGLIRSAHALRGCLRQSVSLRSAIDPNPFDQLGVIVASFAPPFVTRLRSAVPGSPASLRRRGYFTFSPAQRWPVAEVFHPGGVRSSAAHESGRLARMRSGQDAHAPVQPARHTFLTPASPAFNHTYKNRRSKMLLDSPREHAHKTNRSSPL